MRHGRGEQSIKERQTYIVISFGSEFGDNVSHLFDPSPCAYNERVVTNKSSREKLEIRYFSVRYLHM